MVERKGIANRVVELRATPWAAPGRALLFSFFFASQALARSLDRRPLGDAPRTYNFGEVLILSAIGKSETLFTPLSLLNLARAGLSLGSHGLMVNCICNGGAGSIRIRFLQSRNRSGVQLQRENIRYTRRICGRNQPVRTI